MRDKEILNLIQAEEDRQNEGIELIVSENYTYMVKSITDELKSMSEI